jgi:hypothetical protein
MAKTPEDLVWRRVQVDRGGACVKVLAISRPQHGTAACGQNTAAVLGQLVDGRFFKIAKSRFPLALEELADRAAHSMLDHVVRIYEAPTQSPRQLPADG